MADFGTEMSGIDQKPLNIGTHSASAAQGITLYVYLIHSALHKLRTLLVTYTYPCISLYQRILFVPKHAKRSGTGCQ